MITIKDMLGLLKSRFENDTNFRVSLWTHKDEENINMVVPFKDFHPVLKDIPNHILECEVDEVLINDEIDFEDMEDKVDMRIWYYEVKHYECASCNKRTPQLFAFLCAECDREDDLDAQELDEES